MDRTLVYPGQQPTDTVWLSAERNKMIAAGYLEQALLGTGTAVDGLACIPTVPASLAVQIGNGSIYSLTSIDSTPYGTLGLDNVDQIIKQGIALSLPNLTLTPPGTSGQAISYLIQAQLVEQDTQPVVLPYFNSASPLVPWNGPNNSGTAQPTVRQCAIVVQAKAGVAATAGTQVTPSPDAGFVGLYAVTVANGATAITSAQITQLPSAPFIGVKLPAVPNWVQAGSYLRGTDTGTANAINVTLTPPPTSPPALLLIRKVAAANTGAMTVTINNVTYPLINSDASAIISGEMGANFLPLLGYDGTAYRFLNGSATTAVGSLTASSGEGINVNGSAVVALNVPSLVDQPVIGNNDLFPFYSQSDVHHRVAKFSELGAALTSVSLPSLLNIQTFTTAGTGVYTPTAGARTALAFVTGGGGAAGSVAPNTSSPGGSAGGTAIAMIPLAGISSIAFSVGAGGVVNTGAAGGAGGASNLGTYASASGGAGGAAGGSGGDGYDDVGVPGIGLTGLFLMQGSPGGHPTAQAGGFGGNSFWGGGARVRNNAVGSPVVTGVAGVMGGGGSGTDAASYSNTGGAGGAGVIVIFEFN